MEFCVPFISFIEVSKAATQLEIQASDLETTFESRGQREWVIFQDVQGICESTEEQEQDSLVKYKMLVIKLDLV